MWSRTELKCRLPEGDPADDLDCSRRSRGDDSCDQAMVREIAVAEPDVRRRLCRCQHRRTVDHQLLVIPDDAHEFAFVNRFVDVVVNVKFTAAISDRFVM